MSAQEPSDFIKDRKIGKWNDEGRAGEGLHDGWNGWIEGLSRFQVEGPHECSGNCAL